LSVKEEKKGDPVDRQDPSVAPLPEDERLLTACAVISGERYQAFVENIADGVYEVDLQGNYLYFNNSMSRILGHPPHEILFQNFSKFMTEDQARITFDMFHRVWETGEGFSDLLWHIKTQRGEERVIELSANLIRNEKGEPIGFRGIARDITEKFNTQQALQKSERRYRTLLDFVPYPIVVYTIDGRVSYLNPAFTETFGWTLEELLGKTVPFVPQGLEEENETAIQRLFSQRVSLRYESKRLTKDGRVLDVTMRGAVFLEEGGEPSGALVILRDVTKENRIAQNNAAMLRIGLALPEYPELEGLLDYVSGEVKRLMGVESALVILLDPERKEFLFKGAAYEDTTRESRIKEVRFPADKGVAGRVLRTGKPVIVPDTSKDPDFYPLVDQMVHFRTRSMLDVPLRNKERPIGVLSAINKKSGEFDESDVELLSMVAGTVALSVDNARYSEELKEAYKEVSSLNRAKDKVIHHLSHELKTPLAVLGASINILRKRLAALPEETWKATLERSQRNLDRILEMQYEVEDIMRTGDDRAYRLSSRLFDQVADELEALAAETFGEGRAVERIRASIQELYGPKEVAPEEIDLSTFVSDTLQEIRPHFSHREINIDTDLKPSPHIWIPRDVLRKVVVGLLRNAVENTPDEGKIEIRVRSKGQGTEFMVHDYGVGITLDDQKRVFEGFFTTQETLNYSTKRPYDFNAGGKGADLLRMKIFSERYGFRIAMSSKRCPFKPDTTDVCPGRISQCALCKAGGGCHEFGGTTFTVFFPEPS
jgi:PAS domain S-box-containing protein